MENCKLTFSKLFLEFSIIFIFFNIAKLPANSVGGKGGLRSTGKSNFAVVYSRFT